MSVITPSSTVTLCRVPMRYDDPLHNQIYFDTDEDQQDYFTSQVNNRTVDGCSYIRKDGVLRVPVAFDYIMNQGYNYVYYTNEPYSSRIYYAFITGIEYANDGVTFLRIQTDVVQTYMREMSNSLGAHKNFVEREIVASDDAYAYTYPEGLETGEYVHNATASKARYHESDVDDCYVVLAVSDISILTGQSVAAITGTIYNGTPSGFYYLAVEANRPARLRALTDLYDANAKGDAIQFMFLAPKSLLDDYLEADTTSVSDSTIYWIKPSVVYKTVSSMTMDFAEDLNGYVPRNKKLLSFPYCYFIGTNRAGTSVDYHYEDFASSGTNVVFNIYGSLSVGCSIIAIPTRYKEIMSVAGAFDYSLQLAKFPSVSWTSDVYLNWLTSNAVNMSNTREFAYQRLQIAQNSNTVSGIEGVASAIANLAAGNFSGTVGAAGGLAQTALNYQSNQLSYDETIANMNAEKYQHELMPPQGKGNANIGDVQYAMGMIEFALIPMCIKKEYAKIIDDYFDMFGYQINSLKTVQFHTRKVHNYYKIKNATFYLLPMDAAQELRQIFETGISFWNSPTYFGDYTTSNDAVSTS